MFLKLVEVNDSIGELIKSFILMAMTMEYLSRRLWCSWREGRWKINIKQQALQSPSLVINLLFLLAREPLNRWRKCKSLFTVHVSIFLWHTSFVTTLLWRHSIWHCVREQWKRICLVGDYEHLGFGCVLLKSNQQLGTVAKKATRLKRNTDLHAHSARKWHTHMFLIFACLNFPTQTGSMSPVWASPLTQVGVTIELEIHNCTLFHIGVDWSSYEDVNINQI